MSPSHPCSASFVQKSSVTPAGSAMRSRTNVEAHSFSKNFRAVARSSSCSWLNPKSMGCPLFGEPEHALADDVLLDFRRAALDGVGAGAEERVLPEPAVHGPVRPAQDLRVGPLDLHRQILDLLVCLDPAHLARGRLGARDLALEELGDRPRAHVLQALSVDPELGDLLTHDRVLH